MIHIAVRDPWLCNKIEVRAWIEMWENEINAALCKAQDALLTYGVAVIDDRILELVRALEQDDSIRIVKL